MRQRFSREAELLQNLRHPAIVSFVAHGITEEGMPYRRTFAERPLVDGGAYFAG